MKKEKVKRLLADIPVELHAMVKVNAARSGLSIKDYITSILRSIQSEINNRGKTGDGKAKRTEK